MDADTRHQLKQNELAEALSRLRDWNQPTTRYALLAILILVVLVGGWKWWHYNQNRAVERAWHRLAGLEIGLTSEEETQASAAAAELESLIDEAPNPGVATAARLRLARYHYDRAMLKPETREASLAESTRVLEQITKDPDMPPELEPTATFALATNYESMREFDKARELYNKLHQEGQFKGSPYAELAQERLEDLDKLNVRVAFTAGGPPTTAAPDLLAPSIQADGQAGQAVRLTPEEVAELTKRIRQQEGPPAPEGPPAEGTADEPEPEPEQPDESEPTGAEPPTTQPGR